MILRGAFGKDTVNLTRLGVFLSIVWTEPDFHDINSQATGFHRFSGRSTFVDHEDEGLCHGARIAVGEDLAPHADTTGTSVQGLFDHGEHVGGVPARRSTGEQQWDGRTGGYFSNEVASPVQTHFAASQPNSNAT